MLSRRRREQPGDAGFTLVEVLVVVTVLGVVLAAVAAISFVAVRTTAAAETRLDESNDLLRASTYFGDDVQGAQTVLVGAAPQCGADDEAVVELVGQDFADDSTLAPITTVVTYVLRGDTGDEEGVRELHRLSCRAGAGAAYPLTPTTDVPVLVRLSAAEPRVSCGAGPCGPAFAQVDLTVTEAGGLAFTLTGRRRVS